MPTRLDTPSAGFQEKQNQAPSQSSRARVVVFRHEPIALPNPFRLCERLLTDVGQGPTSPFLRSQGHPYLGPTFPRRARAASHSASRACSARDQHRCQQQPLFERNCTHHEARQRQSWKRHRRFRIPEASVRCGTRPGNRSDIAVA